jgi:hypothetical protein
MENQFAEKAIKLWQKIGTHGIMSLATCVDNRVSSRSMSVIVHDEKFYCQTDETFLKYKQITQNPNVALCYNNFSIEGKCCIIGQPLDEYNSFFAERFKKYFFGSFEAYTALPTEKLLEIKPVLIYSWEYELTKPYMEYFDFDNQLYRIKTMNKL